MRMIITAGMPGSGKEEFLIAASSTGIPFLRMGDIVREYYSKRGPKDADLTVGAFANIERERHGFDIWAKRATEKMRYDRLVKRGREDAPKDLEEFRKRDEREISWGLAETMVLADKMIINESSLDDFKDEVVRTMKGFCR